MDRLQIEITGTLPDKGKHAILAACEAAAEKMATDLNAAHPGIDLVAEVRAVKPMVARVKKIVPGSAGGASDAITQGETAAPLVPVVGMEEPEVVLGDPPPVTSLTGHRRHGNA